MADSKDSDWTFYTNVNYDENVNNDPLLKAFNKFLGSFTTDVNVQEITKYLESNDHKRIFIDTEGTKDIINTDNKDIGRRDYVFLKSKFLINKKFKQRLIEFYNPHKIYVKGPVNIV